MGAERPPQDATYVPPGGLHVASAPAAMTTVLGSCVAVCLRDSLGQVGGMIHFVLPRGGRTRSSRLRYANHAIPELIEKVREAGAGEGELEAKIVGGASVLPNLSGKRQRYGFENVKVARRLLGDAGVRIVAEIVGGHVGRRTVFEVDDGTMWVQDLRANHGE